MSPLDDRLRDLIRAHALPPGYEEVVDRVCRPVADAIAGRRAALGRPAVAGLCGCQGSGKSTVAAFVAALLEDAGLSVAVLSLDDLYLTRAERARLAETTHPLLRTRGPPGVHDVALGVETIDALTRPEGPSGAGSPRRVALPRFDKAADDRAPEAAWPVVTAPVDVVLFEGWCVGARPEPAAALAEPVNALEREEDADGRWRAYVNAALSGDYQRLFGRLDFLVLLKPPGFETVLAWRTLQERKLAARLAAEGATGAAVMDDAALACFIMHYERLTRHILREMPERADVTVTLGPEHEVEAVAIR